MPSADSSGAPSIPPISPDTQAPTLLNRLINLFGALLDLTPSGPAVGDRRLRFNVSYGYRLTRSETGPGIETRVPVLARPNYQFDPSRDLSQSSGLCRQLAQALGDWYCSMRPSTQGASWVLDISLYTTLAGTGSSQPPLLHLTELRLALADLAEGELACPREPPSGHGRAG